MDKPLSRRIGAAVCLGAALSVFGVSQPSLTYEIGKSQAGSACGLGRVIMARSVANPGTDLVVYKFIQDHLREPLRLMPTELAILTVLLALMADPSPLERSGWLDEKLIPEASGIVKSRRFPGIFWVHNDSGNPPLLFAIKGDGRIVRQFRLGVPNIDWEDIAIDDQGHLYVGDIGNNIGALPLRAIYRIDEPDPKSPADEAAARLGHDVLCLTQGQPVRRGEPVRRSRIRDLGG